MLKLPYWHGMLFQNKRRGGAIGSAKGACARPSDFLFHISHTRTQLVVGGGFLVGLAGVEGRILPLLYRRGMYAMQFEVTGRDCISFNELYFIVILFQFVSWLEWGTGVCQRVPILNLMELILSHTIYKQRRIRKKM